MIDGTTYYKNQSQARGILSREDVERIADQEKAIFDRLLLPYIPTDREVAIYEAATGPGILQFWLKSHFFKNLQGSDFSENEARFAAQINDRIVHADSVLDLETRFSPESLSTIIALDFLEHIPRERFRDFLAVSASRLKPGGVLIMRGPNADSPFCGLNLYNDMTHVWAYTSTCLRALITLEGFRQITFADDAIDGIHRGYWWKRLVMKPAQIFLSAICWAASRQCVRYWGMSLYVYAIK